MCRTKSRDWFLLIAHFSVLLVSISWTVNDEFDSPEIITSRFPEGSASSRVLPSCLFESWRPLCVLWHPAGTIRIWDLWIQCSMLVVFQDQSCTNEYPHSAFVEVCAFEMFSDVSDHTSPFGRCDRFGQHSTWRCGSILSYRGKMVFHSNCKRTSLAQVDMIHDYIISQAVILFPTPGGNLELHSQECTCCRGHMGFRCIVVFIMLCSICVAWVSKRKQAAFQALINLW